MTLRSMWVLTGSNSRHNRVAYFGRSNTLAKALRAGHALLSEFELLPWIVANSVKGGVTDAQYLFGLGHALGLSSAPLVAPRLPRTIHHILDGGVEGRFCAIPNSALPPLVNPLRAPLFHEGIA